MQKGNSMLKDCHILANKAGVKLRHGKKVDVSRFFVDVVPGCSIGFASLGDAKRYLVSPDNWGKRGVRND